MKEDNSNTHSQNIKQQQQQELGVISNEIIHPRLKITLNMDYKDQGDLDRILCHDMTEQQRLKVIQQRLTKSPQLYAVYSSKWNKIFYKLKSQCKNKNTDICCILYQLKQNEKKEQNKAQNNWVFKGKTRN